MVAYYLKQADIASYKALAGKQLTFGPGLNVVYGANEAGKTTASEFIQAALFPGSAPNGLGAASAQTDGAAPPDGTALTDAVTPTYHTAPTQAGTLEFCAADDSGSGPIVIPVLWDPALHQGADGAAYEQITGDIDADTYTHIFNLSDIEFSTLASAEDANDSLIQAGSGAVKSPATVLKEIQSRIENLTSQDAGRQGSLAWHERRVKDARKKMKRMGDDQLKLIREEKTQDALTSQISALEERITSAKKRVRHLEQMRVDIASMEAELLKIDEQLVEAQAERDEIADQITGSGDAGLRISAAQEQTITDKLDDLQKAKDKAEQNLQRAQEEKTASEAAYEALMEIGLTENGGPRRHLSNRGVAQTSISLGLPLVFLLFGVLVFVYARHVSSLSITALGSSLVLCAIIMAAGSFVSLFRPNKADEALESQQHNAKWVMVQDQKKYQSCLDAVGTVERNIKESLDEMGLHAAQGSLNAARLMVADARSDYTAYQAQTQRMAALDVKISRLQKKADELNARYDAMLHEVGLAGHDSVADALDQASAYQTELEQALADFNAQLAACRERVAHGLRELGRVPAQSAASTDRSPMQSAAHDRDTGADARVLRDELCRVKLDYQLCKSAQENAYEQLAILVFAQQILGRAMDRYHETMGPEVYAQAGELLSTMTSGAWVGVAAVGNQTVAAVDAIGQARGVEILSFATRVQLYLSLRLAYLLTAQDTGRNVPVLADDILMGFDKDRMKAAAICLARLAQKRQVILFTCQEVMVKTLQDADPACTCIQL